MVDELRCDGDCRDGAWCWLAYSASEPVDGLPGLLARVSEVN